MDTPPALLPTVYRVEYRGEVYYSQQYQRVKKRNSYTVAYSDSGAKRFALIEHYVFVQNRLIAILKPLLPVSVSCQQHFNLTTTALDSFLYLSPVTKGQCVKCCFVEQFIAKCLFMDLNFVQYVAQFPSRIMFD